MTDEQPETPEAGEPQETAASPPPGDPVGADAPGETGETGETGPTAGASDPLDLENLGDTPAPEEAEPGSELALAQERVAALTLDLQRLQAEYVNYKRRVDRDREQVGRNATAAAVTAMLPVLDDIDRAREHEELGGGFRAVADGLGKAVASLGLERFGTPGEEFDPQMHEAISHGASEEVTTTTVEHVAQAGYRFGDRVVRAAVVTVVSPA